MAETTVFIIAFSISLILVIGSAVLGIALKKSGILGGKTVKKRSVITPYNIFLIGFFAASAVMAFPVFYCFKFNDDGTFLRVLKSVGISIINSLQTFFLNADFMNIKDAVSESGAVAKSWATAYTTYFAALYVAAPFLTFAFILSFFKDFLAKLKYALYSGADIYVLSEINERSLALANDILENGGKGRKLVVFTDVYGEAEENTAELIAEAKKLGAVCLKSDITELRLKRADKNHKRKFYFIGENEDENLKQALELIDRCKGVKNYDNYDTQFFVFANSTESEVFLDSIDNGNMKVRRITEYRNTILNTLRSHSIFKDAVQKGGIKQINLVIIGIGNYGAELLKTVCWLGQMPGYEVTVHAFDKDNAEEKFKVSAPEFLEMSGKRIDGEPYYNLVFHNSIDIKSSAFCDELSKIDDVTSVYVALGNDELNIETAVKVRTLFGRANIKSESAIPPVYTIVFNAVKSGIFKQRGGLKSMSGKDYNIEFIDGIGSQFRLEVIEQTALEKEGLNCHLKWSKTSEDIEEDKKKYEKYEYYRKSSIAESAHKAAMIELGLYGVDGNGNATEEIAVCEHNRWSAYMRAEGYVYGKKKDDIANTHGDLKPYKKLGEEQKKDFLVKSASDKQ
ncbi:MAG: hypothetical protein K2N22_06835 [Clostridia bacterium]|nr:hypothetical protein [Clostridia bacterium]